MFEDFDALSVADVQMFKKVVHTLLLHTFIVRSKYDPHKGVNTFNPEYGFVERNYELLREYLEMADFTLEKDDSYGVIKLHSDSIRPQRIDKATTLLIYTLRLIYDEEKENLSQSEDVKLSVVDLIEKMKNLGIYTKKPSNLELSDMLRKVQGFNLIYKSSGSWSDGGTRFMILPTVRFVISREKIDAITRMIHSEDEESIEEEDVDEEA